MSIYYLFNKIPFILVSRIIRGEYNLGRICEIFKCLGPYTKI